MRSIRDATAARLLVVICAYAFLLGAFNSMGSAVEWLTYVWLVLLTYGLNLAIRLLRCATGSVSLPHLVGGVAFLLGGAILDASETIIHTPTLEQEANAVLRSLLDSGHSLRLVYAYGATGLALRLCCLCVLWAAFLRNRDAVRHVIVAVEAPSFWALLRLVVRHGRSRHLHGSSAAADAGCPRAFIVLMALIPALVVWSGTGHWYGALWWSNALPVVPDAYFGVAAASAAVTASLVWLYWLYVAAGEEACGPNKSRGQ